MATKADFDRLDNYGRMYNPDQNIDPRHRTRTVPMEVLSLGYSRTGTLSMRKALEILGYPSPYHFSSFYDNVRDCDVWRSLLAAKYDGKGPAVTKADFDGLLGHCGAVTDAPCHLFAPELMEFYPEAKVVIVEREMGSWLKSWYNFLGNAYNPLFPIVARLDPGFLGKIVGTGTWVVGLQAGSAKTLAAAKARSRDEYRKHYALVRALAPKGNTLEFKLSDGWGPLCEFLNKEVPDVPFPHVNEAKQNDQAFKELALLGLRNFARRLAKFVTVVGVVAAGLYYFGSWPKDFSYTYSTK